MESVAKWQERVKRADSGQEISTLVNEGQLARNRCYYRHVTVPGHKLIASQCQASQNGRQEPNSTTQKKQFSYKRISLITGEGQTR